MHKLLRRLFLWLACSFLLLVQASEAQTYAKHGMVVSDSEIASAVGVEILKKGGNAVDASIATALALAVTFPQAGNIGGGGFLVYRDSAGEATTIDFREKAPITASDDMFLDDQGNLIKGSNHQGLKSVGVPGTIAGLYMAHEKYGSLPWSLLVQPAVELAEEGFELTWALSQHAEDFVDDESKPDFLRQLFTHENGELVLFREIWKQPELARTLKIIRDEGEDGFYKGEVAEAIAAHMSENGGLITVEDLAKYEAVMREPLRGSYKDYDIITMPPPSSGGVALIEMMNMMEAAGIEDVEFNSTEYVHLVAEVMRRAFADRARHLGDPDFNPDMPVTELISKSHARERWKSIDRKMVSASDSSNFVWMPEGDHTTHLSVIDKDGNAVSLTYTIEHRYGSGLGVPSLGFLFNNEMGDFNPQPGLTNSLGLIGTRPNIVEPEKRMLSSMSPAIITKDGKPYLIIGSPGGRTIINTVFQTVLKVLAYEMPLREAVESMKIHHQWLPDRIFYEEDLLSPDTREALEEMGHELDTREYLGRLMGILINEQDGILIGVSDSSSPDGGAVGY